MRHKRKCFIPLVLTHQNLGFWFANKLVCRISSYALCDRQAFAGPAEKTLGLLSLVPRPQ